MKKSLAPILLALCVSPVFAADNMHQMSFQDLLDSAAAKEKLDPGISFHLAGGKTPRVLERKGTDSTTKRTNAFNKTAEQSCQWAALSALLAFQAKAKAVGANAVIDITSNIKNNEVKSATAYECAEGALMTNVAFKAAYAKVAK